MRIDDVLDHFNFQVPTCNVSGAEKTFVACLERCSLFGELSADLARILIGRVGLLAKRPPPEDWAETTCPENEVSAILNMP